VRGKYWQKRQENSCAAAAITVLKFSYDFVIHRGRRPPFAFVSDFFYYVGQMPRGDSLGTFEQIVLIALIRLGPDAYGMTVRREIARRTGRSVSIGAVYATLERLETKGFVSSYAGEPTAERGGRSKRFFRIESEGERALRTSQETLRKMTAGLNKRWSAV
jgi:PadR family transcriptional regulator PadR